MKKTTDRMTPYVGSTRDEDTWPEGGYRHEPGIPNRAQRREAFKVFSTRRSRMSVRKIKRTRLYGKPWAPRSKRDPRSHGEV